MTRPSFLRSVALSLSSLLLIASAASGQPDSLIFNDGFESGDTSAWRVVRQQVNGSLDVNPGAALGGSKFGLEVTPLGRAFVQTNRPRGETELVVGFLLNLNDLRLPRGSRLTILQLFGLDRRDNAKLVLAQTGRRRFALRLYVRDDRGQYRFLGGTPLRRGRTAFVEVAWAAATQGGGALFVNREPIANNFDIDNAKQTVERIRLGTTKKPSAATTGSYYLDEFESFRTLAP